MKTMKIFNLMIFKINNQTKQNNIPTRVNLWSKCGANQHPIQKRKSRKLLVSSFLRDFKWF